ncbi:MAG: hypothetical protein A2V93_02550 [Ignavibacteria bacterium RBG_16_34_14]|nr:MAG: hypothetical protein A2V93_02550 [Ignavibacteria bacterium RBG_16_34_14]
MARFLKYLLVLLFLSSQAIYSQFYYFGRNKVQYEKFDWKILRTEHFDIYYYDEMLDIAEIGADYAEEVYDELKVKMNNIVTRRIPLIFYNTHLHFQQTNTTQGFIPEGVGGFFEFIKGRVVIPSMGSLHDFRHVIRHELVHVFMTNKIYRVLVDHREPADVLPPLWFVEGLAEYMSTEVDAQAEMVMRDAILNNYFAGIDDIYNIYGTFLMYKEGQNFLEFVEEEYGKEKVPLMLENFWMFSNFTKVIEHTIGKKIEEIDLEWLYYLKKKYYPLMGNRTPLENASKKITEDGFNFSPVYYEKGDERYIYFVANRNGYSSLYKLELDKNLEAVDDPEIILQGERYEELEAFHLFQSSIDISKNGLLTFVTKKGATDAIHLFSVSRNEIIRTFQFDHLINLTSPKFSPGQDKIVFHAVDQKGYSDIFLLDIENDSLKRLTNDYYDDRDPSFGLDENQILFSSDRTSGEFEKKYNIFNYDLNTNRIEYVTYLNSNNSSPIVSPDKKKILFTSDTDGVRNIWSLEINSYDIVKKTTNFVTSAFYPTFINDSTIIFSGFEKFSFNLYKDELNKTEGEDTTLIAMTFPLTTEKWKAEMVSGDVKREQLKYINEYTLDYAQSQVSTDPIFGTRGGAILSLSDLLGNDNYFFLIYNTADVQSDFLKSFNIAIQRVNLSERTNYGYGVFHFSGRRYDIRDSDEYFFERSFGGFFALHFPLSKFHRLETSVTVANSDKQVISGVIERKALLISNSLSYVVDNSLWGWTGPLDGIRGRLLLGYTSDVKYSNVNYFTVIADYRHYFRLGLRSALAFRSAIFYNEGKEARRYFMGGSWDLRGWRRWSIRGEKLWLSSIELRFPLVDELYIKFPLFGLGFVGFRGAVFFDAGGAWDDDYRKTLGSFGGGLRLNLFGVLVLRYDMGKKIEDDFTRIQDGLFYQFFFGWDF